MRTGGILALTAITLLAQDKSKAPSMDFGPYLSCAVMSRPGTKFDNNTGNFDGDVTPRGFLIRLAPDWSAGAVFDSDNLRVTAGWIGGAPKFTGVIFDGAHGPSPTLSTAPIFETPHGPGWAKEGSFKDPRPDSIKPLPPPGPLPREWGRYTGLYLHGNQTIFSYTVGKTPVLETVGLESTGDLQALARTVQIDATDVPMEMMVAKATDELLVDAVGASITTIEGQVGSSRVDLQACKLEYSIVSPK